MTRLFHTRDRGAVIPIVALLLPVIMIMTAFAIDLGRQRVLRRDLQANADVIALDLVRLTDGRTTSEIEGDPTYLAYVNGSFERNGVDQVTSPGELVDVVTFGSWDDTTDPRFQPTAPDEVPHAVRVAFTGELDYHFQPGSGAAAREAFAVRDGVAVFSVGSRLASLDTANASLLNPILSALFEGLGPVEGTARTSAMPFNSAASAATSTQTSGAAIDALSYEGLATGNVGVNQLLGLIQEEMVAGGADVASPSDVLQSDVALATVLRASADALAASGEGAEVDAAVLFLDALAARTDPDLSVDLGDLLGVDVSNPGAVLGSRLNALDLLLLSAQLANTQNLVSTDLAVPTNILQGIPLVQPLVDSSARLKMAVIEGPQFGSGSPNHSDSYAETSQIRVGLDLGLTIDANIGHLLPLLSLLPSVARIELDLPLSVTVANARADLVGLLCDTTDPTQSLLDLVGTTQAARLRVGTMTPGDELVELEEESPAGTPAQLATVSLLNVPVARVNGGANAPIGTQQPMEIYDLPVGETRRVDAGQIGLRNHLQSTLTAELLGIGLTNAVVSSIVSSLVEQVLNPLLDNIDTMLVAPILDLLGVGTTGADFSAIDANCTTPKLVG